MLAPRLPASQPTDGSEIHSQRSSQTARKGTNNPVVHFTRTCINATAKTAGRKKGRVMRATNAILRRPATQARLHDMVVSQLYGAPPSTEADVRAVMAMDARLSRARIWESRHIMIL